MYYYEISFHADEDEKHYILKHKKKYSKKEFWKMCNKFYHMFPKDKNITKYGGKERVWYSWNENECLEFIMDMLCEEYGFELIEVNTNYFLTEKI